MKRSLISLASAVALVVGACSSAATPTQSTAPSLAPSGVAASTPAGGPFTVTDAMGNKVSFDALPMRVVIAGKALFMVADAAYLFSEAPSRIVAMASTVQNKLSWPQAFDSTYSSKTILDASAGAEQIAATKPDLVLLKSSNATTLGQPLVALGVKVVYVDFETPDQYTRDLATLGQLFGDQARAQQLGAYFQAQASSITTKLAGLTDAQKPKVLVLYYSNKNGTIAFNVPPLSFIQSTEVQLAGGQPVWKDAQLGSSWTTVTLEQIAAWNPDQVYLIAYSGSSADVVATLKADPKWQALKAAKDNAIYAFPADYYSWDQPDPRWPLGLDWLAAKIHPDLFPSFSMDTVARGLYKDLYGLDDATYDKLVKPNLVGSF